MTTTRLQQRLALWWLALALVLAPTLGRMHQVVHAPGLGGAAAAYAVAHGHGHAQAAQGVDAPQALFSGHAGSDCQLLDQQLLGGALLGSPAAQIHALPAAPPAQAAAACGVARWHAAFQARAPPARA